MPPRTGLPLLVVLLNGGVTVPALLRGYPDAVLDGVSA